MKKLLLSLALAGALMLPGFASAEEYIMTGGDQLDINILNNPDLSSTNSTSSSRRMYMVRPDGKVSFPLIGTVDVTGKTVEQFTQELTERFSEYLVNPQISVNIVALGTTRVFVFGEVRQQGAHELTKSHRVLDALGAAKGFDLTAAKTRVFLIRAKDLQKGTANYEAEAKHSLTKERRAELEEQLKAEKAKAVGGKPLNMTKVARLERQLSGIDDKEIQSNIIKLNLNDYLRKGDLSQNPVLHEGDCVYLVRN
ncbi:MAG: polysaccharide export protein, partial [Erysipelotrichaceae bacterium]|nr:polysaccharide export protein [Erysipelotrichaceae bacterium]